VRMESSRTKPQPLNLLHNIHQISGPVSQVVSQRVSQYCAAKSHVGAPTTISARKRQDRNELRSLPCRDN